MALNEISRDKLIALDCHDWRSKIPNPPGRSFFWITYLPDTIKTIKENTFFPEKLKNLAEEAWIAHEKFLKARTGFLFMKDNKQARDTIRHAYSEETLEAMTDKAKKKFLAAEEEERISALELKNEFLLWYKEYKKEVAPQEFRDALIDNTHYIVRAVKRKFNYIYYIDPKNTEDDIMARCHLEEKPDPTFAPYPLTQQSKQ